MDKKIDLTVTLELVGYAQFGASRADRFPMK